MDKKLINKKSKHLLWLDLEMTGLDFRSDLILEVAAIVTDWDFNEVDTYHGIVKYGLSKIKNRMKTNAAFWDANPESRDGLIAQNKDGKNIKKIETDLIGFLDKNFESDCLVILAGNSIHMDRRFIEENWPKFDARLHYRMLDVSAWKVVFENKFNQKFNKPDNHRALDDIRGSIIELKTYLQSLK